MKQRVRGPDSLSKPTKQGDFLRGRSGNRNDRNGDRFPNFTTDVWQRISHTKWHLIHWPVLNNSSTTQYGVRMRAEFAPYSRIQTNNCLKYEDYLLWFHQFSFTDVSPFAKGRKHSQPWFWDTFFFFISNLQYRKLPVHWNTILSMCTSSSPKRSSSKIFPIYHWLFPKIICIIKLYLFKKP